MVAPALRPLELRAARLDPSEIDAFARFVIEHSAESGKDGSQHFAMSRRAVADDVRNAAASRWSRRLDEPNWGRAWLLWGRDPRRVVGHCELRGGRIVAEMHRAVLGMGILRDFTGQGWGRRLLETTVTWARDEARLTWIDLGVFANNEPARRLYRSLGFVELCAREDAFRIDAGVVVDDVQMTLRLR
jgi:ribosomal protein S18 acetylase RimI-like enzyme